MFEKLSQIILSIKNSFKKEMSYTKGSMRPYRDWKIILTITFFILIVLIGVAGYFYFLVSNGNLFVISLDESKREVRIDKNLLDRTIEEINNRKESFDNMRFGSTTPPDPSL